MVSAPQANFSQKYSEAREKFLDAAQRAGAQLHIAELANHKGPDGEILAMDFAVLGAERAPLGLVLVSATHGVEGFCGSACQTGLLTDGTLAGDTQAMRIVIVHAHNPFGFAWVRRVNEDNVDLNRNYLDHDRPYPEAPLYDVLKNEITPASLIGPEFHAANAKLRAYAKENGAFALQAAITSGQYRHPAGLYFGGNFPTWSNRTMREKLRPLLCHQREIAVIDYHSGLGPFGYGEILNEYAPGSPGYARLNAWFGGESKSTAAGDSVSAALTGTLDGALANILAPAKVTTFAIEYGTVPPEEVFFALRADNWLHLYGDLKSPQALEIKRQIRRAFYPDGPQWQRMVLDRSREVVERTVRGLKAQLPTAE